MVVARAPNRSAYNGRIGSTMPKPIEIERDGRPDRSCRTRGGAVRLAVALAPSTSVARRATQRGCRSRCPRRPSRRLAARPGSRRPGRSPSRRERRRARRPGPATSAGTSATSAPAARARPPRRSPRRHPRSGRRSHVAHVERRVHLAHAVEQQRHRRRRVEVVVHRVAEPLDRVAVGRTQRRQFGTNAPSERIEPCERPLRAIGRVLVDLDGRPVVATAARASGMHADRPSRSGRARS